MYAAPPAGTVTGKMFDLLEDLPALGASSFFECIEQLPLNNTLLPYCDPVKKRQTAARVLAHGWIADGHTHLPNRPLGDERPSARVTPSLPVLAGLGCRDAREAKFLGVAVAIAGMQRSRVMPDNFRYRRSCGAPELLLVRVTLLHGLRRSAAPHTSADHHTRCSREVSPPY